MNCSNSYLMLGVLVLPIFSSIHGNETVSKPLEAALLEEVRDGLLAADALDRISALRACTFAPLNEEARQALVSRVLPSLYSGEVSEQLAASRFLLSVNIVSVKKEVQRIIDSIAGHSPDVRAKIAGKFHFSKEIMWLRSIVADGSKAGSQVFLSAIWALGELRNRDELETLLEMSKRHDPTSIYAIVALAKIGEQPIAWGELWERYSHEKDASLRRQCIDGLLNVAGGPSYQWSRYINMLDRVHKEDLPCVLVALGRSMNRDVAKNLEQYSGHQNRKVRLAALTGLLTLAVKHRPELEEGRSTLGGKFSTVMGEARVVRRHFGNRIVCPEHVAYCALLSPDLWADNIRGWIRVDRTLLKVSLKKIMAAASFETAEVAEIEARYANIPENSKIRRMWKKHGSSPKSSRFDLFSERFREIIDECEGVKTEFGVGETNRIVFVLGYLRAFPDSEIAVLLKGFRADEDFLGGRMLDVAK